MLRAIVFILSLLFADSAATASAQQFYVSSLNPQFTPARTSGVAPLAVFFDATATTSQVDTNFPFHELDYSWNFGDSGAGTWAYGNGTPACGGGMGTQPSYCTAIWNTSKNLGYGPVAAHVYETPGIYSVCLTVKGASASVTAPCQTITVTDPNTVFATTATVCVSPASNFTNCPSGATHSTLSNWLTILSTYTGASKRILLHAGEVYTDNNSANGTVTCGGSPGIIDSYDTGAQPDIQMTANGNHFFITFATNCSDWRVRNLNLDGVTFNAQGVNQGSSASQITLENLTGTYLDYGFNLFATSATMDQFFVVGATLQNLAPNAQVTGYIDNGSGSAGNQLTVTAVASGFIPAANGIVSGSGTAAVTKITAQTGGTTGLIGTYTVNGTAQLVGSSGSPVPLTIGNTGYIVLTGDLTNSAFMGNDFENATLGLHVMRHQAKTGLVVNHNYLARAFGGFSTLDIHGDAAAAGALASKVVVSDNVIIGDDAQTVPIATNPENTSSNEPIQDVIEERNFVIGGSGSNNYNILLASKTSVRLNIFDFGAISSGVAANGAEANSVQNNNTAGVPAPTNVWFYNNTVYAPISPSSSAYFAVSIPQASVGALTAQNEILWVPNGGATSSVVASPTHASPCTGCTSGSDNNSVDGSGATGVRTDPKFTDAASYTLPSDFTPNTGSYAIAAGANVPVWYDFFRNPFVNGSYPIGAIRP